MNHEEKILAILLQMQSDISDLKTGQAKLEVDVADLKVGQTQLSQGLVKLENELVPKVTALFDGYTLRGEQLSHLRNHFDEQFGDLRQDISCLFSKTTRQDVRIQAIAKRINQLSSSDAPTEFLV